MQHIIAYSIVAIAIAYASWRIYKAIKSINDPCNGCQGCEIKKQLLKNKKAGTLNKDTKPSCFKEKR